MGDYRREQLEREIDDYFSFVQEYYISIQELHVDDLSKQFKHLFDQEPLIFWGQNCKRFPILAKIAAAILEIPAQVAGSERYFSGFFLIIINVGHNNDIY